MHARDLKRSNHGTNAKKRKRLDKSKQLQTYLYTRKYKEIIGKIINEKLQTHLEENELLNERQFSFMKKEDSRKL